MLINDYEIELSTPACDLESPVYMAKVTLKADISEVLPYVNASVEKGEFVPGVLGPRSGTNHAARQNAGYCPGYHP